MQTQMTLFRGARTVINDCSVMVHPNWAARMYTEHSTCGRAVMHSLSLIQKGGFYIFMHYCLLASCSPTIASAAVTPEEKLQICVRAVWFTWLGGAMVICLRLLTHHGRGDLNGKRRTAHARFRFVIQLGRSMRDLAIQWTLPAVVPFRWKIIYSNCKHRTPRAINSCHNIFLWIIQAL